MLTVARRIDRRSVLRSFSTSSAMPLNPYPAGSETFNRMELCLDHAASAGHDLSVPYEPFLPVDLLQTTIVTFEHLIPLGGWPAAIGLAAVLLRGLVFPVQIWSMKAGAANKSVMTTMNRLTDKLKKAAEKGNSKKVGSLQSRYSELVLKHGRLFPFKGLVGTFLPIPVFLTSLFAMRGFAEHPHLYRGFAMADPFWLDSLCLPDPLYILPGISAALFLTNLELSGRMDSGAATSSSMADSVLKSSQAGQAFRNAVSDETMAKIKRYGMRGLVVSSLYFTTAFPSACFFFFIPNTLLAITQNRLLKQQWFRAKCGLPDDIGTDKVHSSLTTKQSDSIVLELPKGRILKVAEAKQILKNQAAIKSQVANDQRAATLEIKRLETQTRIDKKKKLTPLPGVSSSILRALKTPKTLEELMDPKLKAQKRFAVVRP